MHREYPVLEFDPSREAIIEPTNLVKPADVPEHCVICFFPEVIEKLRQDETARDVLEDHWEDGTHYYYEF